MVDSALRGWFGGGMKMLTDLYVSLRELFRIPSCGCGPDEPFYPIRIMEEQIAKELADYPDLELLNKCLDEEGDEARAKARYIETRIKEMKVDVDKGWKNRKMIR